MKTKEVLSYGIDRNFLRQCEKKGLISPPRIDHEDIIDKDYMRREYTVNDVEVVWNAYLCREMGFTFEEIKMLNSGATLPVRKSIQKMIEDKEREIEELKAMIKYMKVIKAIGVMYPIPHNTNSSMSLADHINGSLEAADKNKMLSTAVDICELLDIDEYNNEVDKKFDCIIERSEIYSSQKYQQLNDLLIEELGFIAEQSDLQPNDDNVQSHVANMLKIQNQIDELCRNKTTVESSAIGLLLILVRDGDYKTFFINLFGEEFVTYLIEALRIYLDIDDIAKINSFFILT